MLTAALIFFAVCFIGVAVMCEGNLRRCLHDDELRERGVYDRERLPEWRGPIGPLSGGRKR